MATCEIKWIDKQGNATPDTNAAIQICRTKDRVIHIEGRNVHVDASRWFYICAEHSKRLRAPGMEIWETSSLITPDDESLAAMLKTVAEIDANR